MAEIGSGSGMDEKNCADDVTALVEEVARLRAELAEERQMNAVIRQQGAEAFADLKCVVRWMEGMEAGMATLLRSLGLERSDHGEEGFTDPVIDLRVVDERIAP